MDLATLREDLVDGLTHPSKGALESETLIEAMRAVPRHEFVDVDNPEVAYEDRAFDHRGTTVLAPLTVATLLEAVDPDPDDEVLIVGAGVGYTAAVVAEVVGARHVNAIDLSRQLVLDARQNLRRAGYDAVLVDRRDGAEGLPEYAPYDRILVEAASQEPPRTLLEQLDSDGRLVLPHGVSDQTLTAFGPDGAVREQFDPVRFSPLLLEGEQTGGIERNRAARENRERAAEAAQSQTGWEHEWIEWE